ncbi:MAG: hypothetical protein B7733_06890 [Myxococcales bacterium FL481]|nr:MAG: hypothetical protein B7733_06890 [Myxococcales bacterium FL481]
MTQPIVLAPFVLLGTVAIQECPLDDLPWTSPHGDEPVIHEMTPSDVLPGDTVTVTGRELHGVTEVMVGETLAQIVETKWKRTIFLVPGGLEAGAHLVRVRTDDCEIIAGELRVPGPTVISLFPQENVRGREVRINGEDLGHATAVHFGGHVLPVDEADFGYDPYRKREYVIVTVPQQIDAGPQLIQVLADTDVLSESIEFTVLDDLRPGVLPSPKRLLREYPFPTALQNPADRSSHSARAGNGEPTHLPPATNAGAFGDHDYHVYSIGGAPLDDRGARYAGDLRPKNPSSLPEGRIAGHGKFESDSRAYRFELKFPHIDGGDSTQTFTGYYTPTEPCDSEVCVGSLVAYDEKGRQYHHGEKTIQLVDCAHFGTREDCHDVRNQQLYDHWFSVCVWLTSRPVTADDQGIDPETGACYAAVPGSQGTTPARSCDDLDAEVFGRFPRLYRRDEEGALSLAEHPCVRMVEEGDGAHPVPDLLNWTVCGNGAIDEPEACSAP